MSGSTTANSILPISAEFGLFGIVLRYHTDQSQMRELRDSPADVAQRREDAEVQELNPRRSVGASEAANEQERIGHRNNYGTYKMTHYTRKYSVEDGIRRNAIFYQTNSLY